VLALVATAAVLGLLAYLLPQLLATRPRSSGLRTVASQPGQSDLERSQSGGVPTTLAVEQRLCRCDVCNHVFVLSFERTLRPGPSGDTTVVRYGLDVGERPAVTSNRCSSRWHRRSTRPKSGSDVTSQHQLTRTFGQY